MAATQPAATGQPRPSARSAVAGVVSRAEV